MSHINHQDATLLGKDTIFGDEAEAGLTGPAVAFSQSEIEDLLYNDGFAATERLGRLREMRSQLSGAETVDYGDDDPQALINEIERAIEELEMTAEGGAVETPGYVDPADHRETLSPDDDLREMIEEEDEASVEDDMGESADDR